MLNGTCVEDCDIAEHGTLVVAVAVIPPSEHNQEPELIENQSGRI